MGETKMTNNLISTNQFCATLDYPVVIRTEIPVSKKSTIIQKNNEAVISINPVFHHAGFNEIKIAEDFFDIISSSPSNENSTKKRETMRRFLNMCPEATLKNINESLMLEDFLDLKDSVYDIIVHFLDKSGTPIKTKHTTIQDIVAALMKLQLKISVKKHTVLKKPSQKPRKKEKVLKKGVLPSGGMRRYMKVSTAR